MFALMREGRPALEEEKKALQKELYGEKDPDVRKEIEAEIRTTQKALDLMELVMPE